MWLAFLVKSYFTSCRFLLVDRYLTPTRNYTLPIIRLKIAETYPLLCVTNGDPENLGGGKHFMHEKNASIQMEKWKPQQGTQKTLLGAERLLKIWNPHPIPWTKQPVLK